MPVSQGQVINKKGRGHSPNKTTKEIREAYTKLVSDSIPKFTKWLDRVAEENPDKALKLIIDLSAYIIPKISQTTLIVEEDTEAKFDYSKLSEEELIRLNDLLNKCNKEI